MIEMKQLQYFVACADLLSFSRAADALYTTQPNVSKVVRSLEEELGFELFDRQGRGIRLTGRGKRVYDYACRALDDVQQLTDFSRMDQSEELLISCNPSSWMAAAFAEFYNANQDEHVCFHVISASTEDIIRRCGAGQDDLGFVSMIEEQMPSFQYRLERNGLEFLELKRTKMMLYFGYDNPMAERSAEEIDLDQVRLVQCYEDEFTLERYWDLFVGNAEQSGGPKVSVVTNSDYVMNRLLRNTNLGNVSGAYLSREEESQKYPGVSLRGEETPVIFGCIRRGGEESGRWAQRFLEFVRERLEEPGEQNGVLSSDE